MRLLMSSMCLLGAAALSACGGGGSGSPEVANQLPTASAKLSGEAVLNAVTQFDTAGTADADGSIASTSWVYGDGQTGSSASHTYASPGDYTATMTVTDDQGGKASASVAVTVSKCSAAGLAAAALSPYTTVCAQTSLGEMVVELYPTQAPATVANFLQYVDSSYYAGTLFHRVIPGFVVQGGGFQAGMVAKSGTATPIVLESNNGLQNWQYTLAMARTSVPDSATSQFFINLVDNHALDYNPTNAAANGYAVFGQVISGISVVDAIAGVSTGAVAGFTDVPVQDVVIRGMVRLP